VFDFADIWRIMGLEVKAKKYWRSAGWEGYRCYAMVSNRRYGKSNAAFYAQKSNVQRSVKVSV